MVISDQLKSTYNYALAYATKGLSVISLKPKSKQPSIAWKSLTISLPSKEQLEKLVCKYRQ